MSRRQLRRQRWHTDEQVYRWTGRGAPVYRRMSDDEKQSPAAEFEIHGRAQYA